MATSKSTRFFIWVIAIVMAVGSVGFYFVIIMDNNRLARQSQQAQSEAEQAARDAQASKQILPGYEATPFEAASVTSLQKDDLKQGDGAEVPAGASVEVNYTGWLPDGTIFDSSNTNGTVTPITLSLDGVIKGWTDGVPGMKVGGVRKLTIPAEQAYGAAGSPPTIPANTPLAFIVEVVSIKQ